MFGAPGSAACAAAARAQGTIEAVGQHCLLSGPDDNLSRPHARGCRPASDASQGQIVNVPRGWVVLQAISTAGYTKQLPISSPNAQFYVLKDNIALRGNDITNPQQSTDPNTGRAGRHLRLQLQGQEAPSRT